MGKRLSVAVLLGLLLLSPMLFAQGSGSDWQYDNVFNLVEGSYGTNIPSWYNTSFTDVRSFTPTAPQLRTAYVRDASGEEIPAALNHNMTVLRMDLLSGTDDIYLRGVVLTLWGSPDFDPNEDLAPIYPDSAGNLFCVPDTMADFYTGIQFYIDKGAFAGSDVDRLDSIDIMGVPEQLLYDLDSIYVGTGVPTFTELTPAYHWNQIVPPTSPSPHAGWKMWQDTLWFKDGIRIPYEGTFNRDEYGLPFYRIWVLVKPIGCHRCATGADGGEVEGLSNRDSFYVEIEQASDLIAHKLMGTYTDGVNGLHPLVDIVDMGLGRDDVLWSNPAPVDPLAERWKRSEVIIGGDTIPPFITDLVPRNEVNTNGDSTDTGCSETGDEIWTADSCQPISFVAYDKSTCVDSVLVVIRYINPGIPTLFPNRIDSAVFKNPLHFAPEDTNGGPGEGWEVNVRPYLGAWSGWNPVFSSSSLAPKASEFDVLSPGTCAEGECGKDTFFIDIGNDVDLNFLPPFIDGAWVEVEIRVYNRNYNESADWHIYPYAYDAYQDTIWNFYVDLSGPNAELICPSTTDDNLTEEFTSITRSDWIENEGVGWRFISDSLPLIELNYYDDYSSVHDWTNHGDPAPFYGGALGGSGINIRDFEVTFELRRLVCANPISYVYDTFVVDQGDIDSGAYFDEDNDGEGGLLWINFDDMIGYRTDLTTTLLNGYPLIPFISGDIVTILQTRLFDDPDYGQGSQRVAAYGAFHTGAADLAPSSVPSYGSIGNPDGNYGTPNTFDNHIPVDPQAAVIYGVTNHPDTLGILRIDLAGPVSPDSFFYPPQGWVTSDTEQVITVDIYDQIGCDIIDQDVSGVTNSLSDYVAGVYGGNDDETRICINLKVRGCDGTWNPDYVASTTEPWEGKTWCVPGWTTFCGSDPLHIEKINNRWGTRLTFAPRQYESFRPGDKVCVTVYAWDNAVTDCPYDTTLDVDLLCYDGSARETITNFIPDRNEGVDKLDPDWLYRTQRQIARFTFFVDAHAPQFVTSNTSNLCDDTLTFTLKDVSADVGAVWCDEWVAGIGAADLRLWIYDKWDGDSVYDDSAWVFFNDLHPGVPTGPEQVDSTTGLTGRDLRYIIARMDYDPADPERGAIIKLYGDCGVGACHFFEPDDSVAITIWAGDNPNVPWYAATERPVSEDGYHANMSHSGVPKQYWWWHYYNPMNPILSGDDYWMSTCAIWRRGGHTYTNENHDIDGTAWVDTFYYNYENPNWDSVWTESFIVQPEIYLKEARWYNDSAYQRYWGGGFTQFQYPPDLSGLYTHLDEVDTSTTDLSVVESYDPYLARYAKDLQFVTAEIYTCTDSLIWECLAGSDTSEDRMTGKTPYVRFDLYDASDSLVWSYEDYYWCHCAPCFIHYEPLRECCKDGGIIKLGPIHQIADYINTVRWTEYDTISTTPLTVDTIPHYGYMNGDSIVVTFGIHSRNPNQFGVDSLSDYHEYRWDYIIDMEPPTARFRRLEGTRGYAEVDCYLMHADNNEIRIRLEDIRDTGVGLSEGGSDALWSTTWPLEVVKPNTDWVKYLWGTDDDEDAGLVYNDGTHYIYTNEHHIVQNCAEENNVAHTMDISPVTMYGGLDETGSPIEVTLNVDTVRIADSLYAEAVIRDRLGNEKYLSSNNLGLDNGLPEVKGFAFASYDPATDAFNDWDRDYFLLPWNVPDQDSLVGVYNFGAACTVYVRLWFNDNMDMREASPEEGYIVRFQPEGWTHWFPVIPMDMHAGFYPLSNRYVNYDYGPGGALRARPVDGVSPEMSEDLSSTLYDDGWNTDREWIGYMVVAGDNLMDGVAKLRVQGFDDNAGNVMLERDFSFRIESNYIEPSLVWPSVDSLDTSYTDPWRADSMDDHLVLTGNSVRDWGPWFCITEPTTVCHEVTGINFDVAITDSVRFDFYWSYTPFTLDSLIASIDTVDTITMETETTWVGSDFHYTIDDMHDPNISIIDPVEHLGQASVPCSVIDILHQFVDPSTGGALVTLDGVEVYLTIRFRGFSRFYPGDYTQDYTMNILIDNEGVSWVYFTTHDGGEITPDRHILIFPSVTETTRICLSGVGVLDDVDYIDFYLENMVTGATYPIYPDSTPPYDDEFAPVGVEGVDPIWYSPDSQVVCYDWITPDGRTPGFYTINARGYDAIHIVTDTSGSSETYAHSFCIMRDSILVPRESFLARGDNYSDAILGLCDNYPAESYCDDIYPWTGESNYPDWPGWVQVGDSIVEGYPHIHRFQITTFTNPDYSEGSDPLLHPYTEQGGYPGDSLFLMFWKGDADSVDLHVEDEYGGDISGSNREFTVRLYPPDDIRIYEGDSFYVFNWIVDDQDNRYDGPVKVTYTTYEQDVTSSTVVTDHVTYFLLDTYDPEYHVSMTRMDSAPLRVCVSDDYPGENIWVTNADTIDVQIEWDQTVFDQAEGAEDYTDYDAVTDGRIWEQLRLTIDGQPHIESDYTTGGFHTDDPNDLYSARLWQRYYTAPTGGFWLPSSDFGDDIYDYKWTVAADPAGNGIARVLVKGRDVAGNILTYNEATLSRSYGKYVLVDTEDPTIDPDLVSITSVSFAADIAAFGDNFLGAGYEDPTSGGYLFTYVFPPDYAGPLVPDSAIAGPYWANDDGSVTEDVATLTAGDTVLVVVWDLAGNYASADVPVLPHEECCSYDLCAGWNMIAISVIPADAGDLVAGTLFPGMDVYRYVGSAFVPVATTDTLNNSEGYLVLASAPTVISICGDPLDVFTATDLMPGFNMIGAPWVSTPTTSADVVPAGAIDLTNVYYYDCSAGGSGGYVPTTTFEHCRGHILLASDTCSITVPGSRRMVYSLKTSVPEVAWTTELNIAGSSLKRTLTIGVGEKASEDIEFGLDEAVLPALPGEADAYLDNHLAKSVIALNNQNEWTLTLTDAAVVSVDNVPDGWTIAIDGVAVNGSVALAAGVHKVAADIKAIPKAFGLAQNRPNPFNAATALNYNVASASHITLDIYNVLGEKVNTLIDEDQQPGYRTVIWNGSDADGNTVPSGIYFCKMVAGDWSATRKITLMK